MITDNNIPADYNGLLMIFVFKSACTLHNTQFIHEVQMIIAFKVQYRSFWLG